MDPRETVRIDLPAQSALQEEPALTFGELFGNKVLLKGVIAAIIAALVMVGVQLPDGLDTRIADIVYTLAPIVAMLYTAVSAKTSAKRQAEATRDVVYAPATVEAIAKQVESGASVKTVVSQ